MKLSVLFPETRSVDNVVALAQTSEQLGFHGMFLGTAFGIDPIMALAHAGTMTTRLTLGVAVVPTWPRHPQVLAQQAATANAMCQGRFRLGVGPSHAPVMARLGILFDRPVSHLREYLTIVRTLLAENKIAHEGERYQVQGMLDVEGGGTPPVLLAAMRPQMCRLAGSHSDGVLPWLPPSDYVASTIVPNVQKGAEAAGRAAPPVIAEVPVALTTDLDDLRAMAARDLFIYPLMPFYRAQWEAAGVPLGDRAVAGGWSDAMFEVSLPFGDEDLLARKIKAYFDAGADEVVVSPYGVGDDPAANRDDCLRVLADIAKG
jgi:F420-dependent oxidoreductase-like protein